MGNTEASSGTLVKRRKQKNKNKFKLDASEAAQAQALHATASPALSKRQKRKQKQRMKAEAAAQDAPKASQQQQQQAGGGGGGGRQQTAAAAAAPPVSRFAPPPAAGGKKKGKGGGSLLEQMRARLQGGRFRWLNEAMYTSDGAAALAMVQREPGLMQQYHEGFREQTKAWPVQPVDQALAWLRTRPAAWAVADLGCGDAKIAAHAKQKVLSFDLASTAPGVVACNMADLPLEGGSVDAAIFCLSLMGTDYGSFVEEAARVLRPSGWLWVAEVQSRFVDGEGRSVLPAFEAALGALGFAVRRRDTSNSHFLVLEAQRQGGGKGGGTRGARPDWPELRPCQYKKR